MEPTVLGVIVTVLVGIIALSTTLLAVVAIRVAAEMRAVQDRLRDALAPLQHDGPSALRAARSAAEDLQRIMSKFRDESHAVTDLSGDLRRRIRRAADTVEERIDDLDALFSVVYGEVEETALDVTAGLRTLRRGRSVVGRMRRALFSRR